MPLRRLVLALAAGMFACMVISVTVSISASNRAIRENIAQEREQEQERDRLAADLEAKQREADAKQQEEGRRVTCYLVNSQVKVFQENEPTTPTGRDLAKAWEDTARLFGCDKK